MTCRAKRHTEAKLITVLGISLVLGLIVTRSGVIPGVARERNDAATPGAHAMVFAERTAGIKPSPVDDSLQASESAAALNELLQDLETARTTAASLDSYSAILEMQEVLNDKLSEPEMVDIKFRMNPFSVYMHWRSNSQEALFVSGQNDEKVLVRPAGGLAAIKRLWRLEPDSQLARQSSRYPVTDAGLLKFAERVLSLYRDGMHRAENLTCTTEQTSIGENNFREYTVRFTSQDVCKEYSACHYRFDMKSKLLLLVENFGWGTHGAHPLVEKYRYDSIDTSTALSDADFDHRNPQYDFVARSN